MLRTVNLEVLVEADMAAEAEEIVAELLGASERIVLVTARIDEILVERAATT